MKIFRQRRPSVNTLLGITRAKRRIARATGIPTTRTGRKRKALNTLTGGAYGRYERARAAINRPFKLMKRVTSHSGCLLPILGALLLIGLLALLLTA
ncbi:MAG: hypothetical protein IJH78_05550 [Clostridia bacterium]|nr:hypothetical protein [Clostridia bacterium]